MLVKIPGSNVHINPYQVSNVWCDRNGTVHVAMSGLAPTIDTSANLDDVVKVLNDGLSALVEAHPVAVGNLVGNYEAYLVDPEYIMTEDLDTLWITVGEISVRLARTSEGVQAELYPLDGEEGDPLSRAEAFFEDAREEA